MMHFERSDATRTSTLLVMIFALIISIASPAVTVEAADERPVAQGGVTERFAYLQNIRQIRVEAIAIPALPGYRTYRGERTREDIIAMLAQREAWKRRATLVPLASEDQNLVIDALSRELAKETPSWPLIQEALAAAESGVAEVDDLTDSLRAIVQFPRGEKVSQSHAQSLRLALSTAGYVGTDASLSLLSEATTQNFWLEAGPVRTDLVGLSENSERSVWRLRVEAVQSIANGDTTSAREALHALRVRTPPLESNLEAEVDRMLNELDDRAEVSLSVPRDEPPRGAGPAWERLAAIVEANDAHINEVSDRLRAQALTGSVHAGTISRFRQAMADARNRQPEEGEIAFIEQVLVHESRSSAPDWTLLREAILAMRHLHVEDDDIVDSLRKLVEFPRTRPIPDAQLESIDYAVTVIGRIGSEKAVALLEEMTTPDFWESSGPLNYPPSQRQLRDGEPMDLMRLNAISALGLASPDLARPVLRRIAAEYREYRNIHSATGERSFEYLVNPTIDHAFWLFDRRRGEE